MNPADYEIDDGMEYVDDSAEEDEEEESEEELLEEQEEDEEGAEASEGEGGEDAPATTTTTTAATASSSVAKRGSGKGVVYLSRIPFSMTPVILRNMFSDVGKVGRMYLKVKEMKGGRDAKKKQRHMRHYSDGWVEFMEKKHAKRCAMLNNTEVGGGRRTKYAHELWNIKYLSKFTWEDLKDEQIIKKEFMKREVARVQKEGLKEAEDLRRTYLKKHDGKTEGGDEAKPKGGKKGGKKGGSKGSKGAKGAKGGKGSKGAKGGKKGSAQKKVAGKRKAEATTTPNEAKKRKVVE